MIASFSLYGDYKGERSGREAPLGVIPGENDKKIPKQQAFRYFQDIRFATTTSRPLTRVYSQVDRVISLSP